VNCPQCRNEAPPEASRCPACGAEFNPPTVPILAAGETRLERDESTLFPATAPAPPIPVVPDPGTLGDGRYAIESQLGAGGMGTVYKAFDRVLGETVALKLLKPDLLQDPSLLERFKSEIRLARQVRHPNVCSIYEFGESELGPFISMELVQGSDLKHRLRNEGALPPGQALALSIQVAEGLHAVHEAGIVHRDLKCANLMVDARGRVRLMDFGIAKREGESAITTGQMVLGTPDYMSPEQAQAKRVTFRSDVYSLGVVIFELFTGRLPFSAATPLGVALKHVQEPPPLEDPLIPPGVRRVLEVALAKSPSARYASARAVASALAETQTLAAAPASLAPPPRGRRAWPFVAAALVIALAAAGITWLRPSRERQVATAPGGGVAPAAASLLVVVRPWGELSIDGKLVGTTPLDWIDLPAGSHAIRVHHPSQGTAEQSVLLAAGEHRRIVVDLTAATPKAGSPPP
jgi:serine/threonine-protein kinase